LSAGVVTGLWVLALLDLTFGTWLLAVAHDAARCTGLPCTLGDHPSWALVLSQVSAVLLVALLPANQAAVGGGRLAGIAVAGIGGSSPWRASPCSSPSSRWYWSRRRRSWST
jgi:hypothetical protein